MVSAKGTKEEPEQDSTAPDDPLQKLGNSSQGKKGWVEILVLSRKSYRPTWLYT